MRRICIPFFASLLLAACATDQPPAPISDRVIPPAGRSATHPKPVAAPVVVPAAPAQRSDDERPATYKVKRGDTLFRIAFEHGLSYRDLAAWNQLSNVNDIKADQVLQLRPPAGESSNGVEVRPLQDGAAPAAAAAQIASRPAAAVDKVDTLKTPKAVRLAYSPQNAKQVQVLGEGAAEKAATVGRKDKVKASDLSGSKKDLPAEKTSKNEGLPQKPTEVATSGWVMPTVGKLLRSYSEEKKGVDIGGKMGQSVVASESGKVVYAGSGLRGYGKMVIIKHDNAFLSAYAHNSKLLVKEGDAVKKGEKIAEMGNTDADRVKLHFEIRKFGKPVNPTKFITLDGP